MVSCRDVVNGALRKLGKLAGGREPRVQDSTDALDALKGLYAYFITSGAFGRIYDVVPSVDYTAGENERVFRNSDAVLEVSLPELVRDYSCGPLPYDQELDVYDYGYGYPFANGLRPPRDGAVVSVIDAFSAQTVTWIYDGQNKLWQSIYDLTLDSVAPLAARDPDGLKSMLACQIADEFGANIGPMTLQQSNHFKQGLTHRYDMPEYGRSWGIKTVTAADTSFGYSLDFSNPKNSGYITLFAAMGALAGVANDNDFSLDFSKPKNSGYITFFAGMGALAGA